MRIGIKLDLGFSERESYLRLFGHRDILDYLRSLGINAVETPVGRKTEDAALLRHMERCVEAGLSTSLHPYTEGSQNNPAFFSLDESNPCLRLHQRFFELAQEAASLQEVPAVVNIHPAAGPHHILRKELLDRSVSFFDWARRWCSDHAPLVRPVAELQIRPEPEESIQRIGDHYDELLEVVKRSQAYACWDFGHAFMNYRRFGLPLDPPEPLLKRVFHVHCHDGLDEDHQPLGLGRVPWEGFLKNLFENGFHGAIILEIPPQHFLAAGGLQELEHSFHALLDFVQKERGS